MMTSGKNSESTPSAGLQALLRYAKSENRERSWRGVAQALSSVYSNNMRLLDVLSVMLNLYEEALSDPRYELGHGSTAVKKLLLAPVKGFHSVEINGPSGLQSQYTVEQFYNAMVSQMLGELLMARIDWCSGTKQDTKTAA
jgi:hypothetical protein